MLGETIFTWANQRHVTLSISKPEVINENIFIERSLFKDIEGDSTLTLIDKNYCCSIDKCTFIRCTCKTQEKGGAIHFVLTEHGSVSITRSIASECMSKNEGNFAYLKVSEFGNIITKMTSIDKCSPDASQDSYHTMFMISGTQIVSNINNTRCYSTRHSAFTNHEAYVGLVDFCNIADNEMKQSCLHYITGNADVRHVNYVNNVLNLAKENLEGVVSAYRSGSSSRVFLSDCVIQGNKADYIISAQTAVIHLVGCNIQNGAYAITNNGNVINNEPNARSLVTMTLMAGAGKHADIPYRSMTCEGARNMQIIMLSLIAILRE